MRPVDKGTAPDVVFEKYQDAEPYLEERIGAYCSFCELHIQHVPEVEHREAKSTGGEELEWDNLLLSCKYCNTRKGTIVKAGEKDKYLWPDIDDTFHAFSYKSVIPELNSEHLNTQDESVRRKAGNLYRLIKLSNVPISPKDKDRRFKARNEARNCAIISKESWMNVKDTEEREPFLVQIILLAKALGFFSTWMEIFSEEEEVKSKLIDAFKGTRKECCGYLKCEND